VIHDFPKVPARTAGFGGDTDTRSRLSYAGHALALVESMKLALLTVAASALTRQWMGVDWIADGLWFVAALQVSWLFHTDATFHRLIPASATPAVVRVRG